LKDDTENFNSIKANLGERITVFVATDLATVSLTGYAPGTLSVFDL
jgi:hypothetical protein